MTCGPSVTEETADGQSLSDTPGVRPIGSPRVLELARQFRPLLIALLLVAGLALLTGGLVFSYRLAYTDTLFRGVQVGGVPVGGCRR